MDKKFGFCWKIVVYHVVQHWDINSTGLMTNTCECTSVFCIENGSMVKASSKFDPLGARKERVSHITWLNFILGSIFFSFVVNQCHTLPCTQYKRKFKKKKTKTKTKLNLNIGRQLSNPVLNLFTK